MGRSLGSSGSGLIRTGDHGLSEKQWERGEAERRGEGKLPDRGAVVLWADPFYGRRLRILHPRAGASPDAQVPLEVHEPIWSQYGTPRFPNAQFREARDQNQPTRVKGT